MRIRNKVYTNKNSNLFVLFDLNNLFHIGCIAATLSLQILCIKHYFRDEDVSSVHFAKFDPSNAAVYPSISICILQVKKVARNDRAAWLEDWEEPRW